MPEQTESNLFSLGTIVGFLGLKGDVKLQASTNSMHLVNDGTKAEIQLPDGRHLPVTLKQIRHKGNTIVLAFEEFTSRTEVEKFVQAKVVIDRQYLNDLEDNEFWFNDLIGLPVFTTEGKSVGTVCSIIEGQTQLLEIKPLGQSDDKTILVPFVDKLVPLVDLSAKRIEVTALPGLLEPQ